MISKFLCCPTQKVLREAHLCDCVVVRHGESLVVGDEDGGDLDVVILDVLVDALLVADRQSVPGAAEEGILH